MKKNNCVLLIFDDLKEVQFFETNLAENEFEILKTNNLKDAFVLANKFSPYLVVINVPATEEAIIDFSKKVKIKLKGNISILSLIESDFAGNQLEIDHHVVKPVRPKLLLSIIRGLMNKEDIHWLPAIQ